MLVRTAGADDAAVVADLHRYLHQPHVDAMPQEYPPYDPDEARRYYADVLTSGRPMWLAEVSGRAVGFAGGEVLDRSESPFMRALRVLYIHQIVVVPQVRGHGVARALMSAAEQQAAHLGCAEVRLEHRAFNSVAHRFYESLGYRTHLVGMAKSVTDSTG